jgi:hypothetical protein
VKTASPSVKTSLRPSTSASDPAANTYHRYSVSYSVDGVTCPPSCGEVRCTGTHSRVKMRRRYDWRMKDTGGRG